MLQCIALLITPKAFDCVDHNKLWKIIYKMEIPNHLTCLLRNLYAGQEATVRTRHRTMDWFQIGKGECQGCKLSPCLFNLHAEWKKVKVKVKLLSHARLFATPWTVAHQAPLSIGFSRQEFWSGLPFPSPGDLPHPETESVSPAWQADSLPLSHQGSRVCRLHHAKRWAGRSTSWNQDCWEKYQ